MSTSTTTQRRQVFIDKAFQGRFILGVFLLILLSGLCSALLIYWLTGDDLQAQSQNAHASIMTAWQRLGVSIFIGNVVAIILAGVIAAVVVVYLSHKIAGPLYRFEKLCEQIGNGNYDGVTQLREHDQLQQLSTAFAAMTDSLKNRQKAHQQNVTAACQLLEQLQADQTLPPEHQQTLVSLADTLKQLQP